MYSSPLRPICMYSLSLSLSLSLKSNGDYDTRHTHTHTHEHTHQPVPASGVSRRHPRCIIQVDKDVPSYTHTHTYTDIPEASTKLTKISLLPAWRGRYSKGTSDRCGPSCTAAVESTTSSAGWELCALTALGPSFARSVKLHLHTYIHTYIHMCVMHVRVICMYGHGHTYMVYRHTYIYAWFVYRS